MCKEHAEDRKAYNGGQEAIRERNSQHFSSPAYLYSGLLRMPSLLIFQRLVKSLYLALIAKYSQLHDREYH